MLIRLLPLLLILFLVSISTYSQNREDTYAVSAAELEEWISFLSSDQMKGRQNGSPEMEEAAHWLAQKFEEFDLKPAYPDGKLVRTYTFHSRRGGTIHERNIVGMIEGKDPELKDEYIIISAHFDHVGIRQAVEGDSIYNGADDNAAGTCTLLGLALTIKENQYTPGRTLLFASVSGEEMGIHGSRHLASDMPLPPESAYANINFEMTGHSEYLGQRNYYMTGCDFSNLDDVIQEFTRGGDHQLIDTIAGANRMFYMSDNIAFARLERDDDVSTGIPCGTFATTTFGEHIHTPFDEADLFDFENMAGLVDHFASMVIWLSHSHEDIDWTNPRFRRIE
ncbi:MAG: M28 family peptidase [Bacteroidota bacterium]|nr:M28 family peptidase [Bacteroidota bacterium]